MPTTDQERRDLALDGAALDDIVTRACAAAGVADAAVALLHWSGEVAHEVLVGDWTPDRQVHIASATKIFTTSTVMTLVNDGSLGLGDPVVAHVPGFDRADPAKAAITVRQLVSLMSGQAPQHPDLRNPKITLAECVDRLAEQDLAAAPGTTMIYGGNGFHTAARVAEVAAGQGFNELFAERVCEPLGLTSTAYLGQPPYFGPTDNPHGGGGVNTTLRDFEAFLRLPLCGGPNGDMLNAELRDEMHRDQTAGAPIGYTAYEDERRYGLGFWIDEVAADGAVLRVSSAGAKGTVPFINLRGGYAGVVMMDAHADKGRLVYEHVVAHIDGTEPAPVRPDGSRTRG